MMPKHIMSKNIKAYNNILDLIGNTPLVKLNNITKDIPGDFYAKVEAFNPGHSNKDRIALPYNRKCRKKRFIKTRCYNY